MQVAGHWGHGALEEAVDRCQADVLIVQEHADRSDGYYRPILLRHPALKIFVLTEDGRNASCPGVSAKPRRGRVADHVDRSHPARAAARSDA